MTSWTQLEVPEPRVSTGHSLNLGLCTSRGPQGVIACALASFLAETSVDKLQEEFMPLSHKPTTGCYRLANRISYFSHLWFIQVLAPEWKLGTSSLEG